MGKINIDTSDLSKMLMKSVSETFDSMCKEKFSKEPTFEEKKVELFDGSIEISGFGKFATKCYLSAIYFYTSIQAAEKNKPCGGMVIYIKDSGIFKLMKKMNQNEEDEKDEEVIKDMCGEFCNVIAGAFRQTLAGTGHDLQMGTPLNARDSLKGGFKVERSQKIFYELKVFLFDSNPVVIDLFL